MIDSRQTPRKLLESRVGIITETLYPEYLAIINLLDFYDEYEKECYNDSTAIIFGYFYNWDDKKEFKAIYEPKGGVLLANLIKTEDGFIHREPTFQGFIKFLRKKCKEKIGN